MCSCTLVRLGRRSMHRKEYHHGSEAPTDIAKGRKALGCFSVANRLISKVRQDSAHALPRLPSEHVIETNEDRNELCIEMRA